MMPVKFDSPSSRSPSGSGGRGEDDFLLKVPKKLRTYVRILLLLKQGLSQFEVRQKLGISKQLVSYHVNKAVKQGLFTVEKIGNTKVYHPTPLLNQYLADLTKGPCPPSARQRPTSPPAPPSAPSEPQFTTTAPLPLSELLDRTLPRIHFLQLALEVEDAPTTTIEEQVGVTSIHVASSPSKIVITVTSDFPGLDLWGFQLLIHHIQKIVRDLTGKDYLESDFQVLNFQVNIDIQGLRIDGAKSITLLDLHGALARVYQKTEKTIRCEWQANARGVQELVNLMRGGVATYQVWQAIFMLSRDIRGLADAVKFMNSKQIRMQRLQEEIVNTLVKLKEVLEKMEKGWRSGSVGSVTSSDDPSDPGTGSGTSKKNRKTRTKSRSNVGRATKGRRATRSIGAHMSNSTGKVTTASNNSADLERLEERASRLEQKLLKLIAMVLSPTTTTAPVVGDHRAREPPRPSRTYGPQAGSPPGQPPRPQLQEPQGDKSKEFIEAFVQDNPWVNILNKKKEE